MDGSHENYETQILGREEEIAEVPEKITMSVMDAASMHLDVYEEQAQKTRGMRHTRKGKVIYQEWANKAEGIRKAMRDLKAREKGMKALKCLDDLREGLLAKASHTLGKNKPKKTQMAYLKLINQEEAVRKLVAYLQAHGMDTGEQDA